MTRPAWHRALGSAPAAIVRPGAAALAPWEFPLAHDLEALAADRGPGTSGPGWSRAVADRALADLHAHLRGRPQPDCLALPALAWHTSRRGLATRACTPAQLLLITTDRLLLWTDLLGLSACMQLRRLTAMDEQADADHVRLTLHAPGQAITVRWPHAGQGRVQPFTETLWRQARTPSSPSAGTPEPLLIAGRAPAAWRHPGARRCMAAITSDELLLVYGRVGPRRPGARTLRIARPRLHLEQINRRGLHLGIGQNQLTAPLTRRMRGRLAQALAAVPAARAAPRPRAK